jgi:hypothetical protein
MQAISFLSLPTDLHLAISKQLDIKSFVTLQRVCHRFRILYNPLQHDYFRIILMLELENALVEHPSRLLPRRTIRPNNICTFLLAQGLAYIRAFLQLWTSQRKQRAQRIARGDDGSEIQFSTGPFWRKMLEGCLISFAWDREAAVPGSKAEQSALEILHFLLTDWTSGVDEFFSETFSKEEVLSVEDGVLADGRYGSDVVRSLVGKVQNEASARMCVGVGGLEVEPRPGEEIDPEHAIFFQVARSGNAAMMQWLVDECRVDIGVEDIAGKGVGCYVMELPLDLKEWPCAMSSGPLVKETKGTSGFGWDETFERFIKGKEECLRILVKAGMAIDGGRTTPLQHLFKQNTFVLDYLRALRNWKRVWPVVDEVADAWKYLQRMLRTLLELDANTHRGHVTMETTEPEAVDIWDSLKRHNRGSSVYKEIDEETDETESLLVRCGIIGQVLIWAAIPSRLESRHKAMALQILEMLFNAGVKIDLQEAKGLTAFTRDGEEVLDEEWKPVAITRFWGEDWTAVENIYSKVLLKAGQCAAGDKGDDNDEEVPLLVAVS